MKELIELVSEFFDEDYVDREWLERHLNVGVDMRLLSLTIEIDNVNINTLKQIFNALNEHVQNG